MIKLGFNGTRISCLTNNNNISTISVIFAKNFEFELKFWENFIKCQSPSSAFAWSIIRNDKYSSMRILCKGHKKYVCRGRRVGNHGKGGKIVARLWFEFQSNGLWMLLNGGWKDF